MPISAEDLDQLSRLLAGDIDGAALGEFLIERSRLPGSRANLELVDAVADRAAAGSLECVDLLADWTADDVPANDPREFLPLVAVVALGAIYAENPDVRAEVSPLLRASASSPRWRTREGAAMALQRIGEHDFADLRPVLASWMEQPTWLERRAVVAVLAHPPFMKRPQAVDLSLRYAGENIDAIRGASADDREGEPFKALRQGMGYAVSVFVAAAPERGFQMLEAWAATPDRDVRAIIRENLKKNRLVKPYATEIGQVNRILQGRSTAGS